MFLLSLSRTGNEKAGLRFEHSYLGVMGILGIHASWTATISTKRAGKTCITSKLKTKTRQYVPLRSSSRAWTRYLDYDSFWLAAFSMPLRKFWCRFTPMNSPSHSVVSWEQHVVS